MNKGGRTFIVVAFLAAIINIGMFLWNLDMYLEFGRWWNMLAMGFSLFAAIVITAMATRE